MIGAGSVTPRGHAAAARIGDSRGFTLIETLVAMVTGLVLMLALFAILDFSTRQASRAANVTQATQLGRIAMTRLIDELRSTCQSPEEAPVLKESNASELYFENAQSKEAVIPQESAFRHRIFLNEKEKGGALWDYTWNASGGAWPEFTYAAFNTTPSSKLLLGQNVTHTGSTPLFTYYKYATTAGSIETNKPVSTLTAMSPPTEGFTAEEAKTVASVLVSFRTASVDGTRTVDLAGQATFSFSAPVAEATIKGGPCQ